MVQESDSRSLDKVIVRLPDGMRDRIKAAAEANNRSMNAEIVATLDEAYPAPFQYSDISHHLSDVIQRADRLRREISRCQDEIEKTKDEDELAALFERYRALTIVEKQIHNELMAVYLQFSDDNPPPSGHYAA